MAVSPTDRLPPLEAVTRPNRELSDHGREVLQSESQQRKDSTWQRISAAERSKIGTRVDIVA
ncbi:MAG: hypothetical protein OEY64_00970 [Nitrospinota bacterium]|nr:hypothetical protein [Nitrospinota bacterium]